MTAVGYTSSSKTISVTPLASAVENNKAYELTLEGVKALDGSDADGYTQAFSLGTKVNATLSVPADYDGAPKDKVNPALTGSVVKIGTTNNATADADYTLEAFRVTVNFNGRAIDTDTLKPGTVKLVETDENGIEKAGTEVAGTITYDAATFSATFVPTAPLKESTNYKVTATKAIKDILGLEVDETYITFKTGDFTLPTVVSSNIDTGKRLGKKDALKVTFNEKMTAARFADASLSNGATINYTSTGSVVLLDESNADVAVSVTLDPADTTGKTYSIIPSSGEWNVNKTYTVKINGKNFNQHLSAADEAGNPLTSEYTATFTTADTSIPAVTSVMAYANGYTGAKANVELLGSTASNPATGIEENGTVPQESIYIHFNRVVDGGFLSAASYELSTDGGKTYGALTGFTPTAFADDEGNNTIVQLKPAATTTVSGETAYAIRLKKDTATVDAKKLVDNVVVYYSTEVAKPAMATANTFQVFTSTDNTKGDVTSGTTTAVQLNKGIALKLTEAIAISTINNDNLKIEDVTDAANPTALVGAFYEDITQAAGVFTKSLLSTTVGAATDDALIYWTPSSDDNKLVAGHKYKVTVSGVKDAVGNEIAAPFVEYFTVADTSAPTVVSTSVTNGQQDVSVQPSFTVTFSKDVSTVKPSASTITLATAAGTSVPVEVTYDKDTKTATVTPLVFLDKLTQYNLTIDDTIADASASLGADTVISFTTEDQEVEPQMTSAKWDTTAKTLTLKFNQPIKAGTVTVADVIVNNTALDAANADIAISPDRKTIVLSSKFDVNGLPKLNIIPGVHAISVKAGGNIAPATGDYKEAVTVSTLAAATGTVTFGIPADLTAATGTVTFGAPTNGDTITVDGTVFTKAADNTDANFVTADDLASDINALTNVGAANAAGTITITAATAGAAGNAITLAESGTALDGNLDLSAATLAGGKDATIVTVDGTAFTKALNNTDANFVNADDLASDINALTNVGAANAAGTITITAATQGEAGNAITIVVAGDGTTSVSGATLAGGADATTQTSTNSIVIE